jgi:hypothetical protein
MMRSFKPLVGLLVLAAFAAGGPPLRGADVRNEAGFMAIEPVSFYFHYGSYLNRLDLRSSEARLFYSFQAAESEPERKPLFVFFNGGPGSATSFGLMSMCTGRYTLDNRVEGGGDAYIANATPWTRLGNLLYVDAREAGFSYNLMDGVSNELARWREFNAQNFNPLFDAADFIRLILRFLAAHPALRANRVVIVGESYGGDRATCLLHLLLNYADYGNGRQMLQDPALSGEIQEHIDAVFPEYRGRTAPPEVVARQFGHQILVQPSVPWGYREVVTEEMLRRPGSELYRIAAETGVAYSPEAYPDRFEYLEAAGRDPYIYVKPEGWLDGFFNKAGVLLRTVANLVKVTGADIPAIPQFYASARSRAYRVANSAFNAGAAVPGVSASAAVRALFIDPAVREAERTRAEPGDMTAVFGALQPWDRYFIGSNRNSNWAFHTFNVAMLRGYEAHPTDLRYGRMFLENLVHVETFVTDAAYDLVVYARAFAPSLARYGDIVASAVESRAPAAGESRPGRIVVSYRPGAFPGLPAAGTRTIRFPPYEKSCHAVSLTQPAELFDDAAEWLRGLGVAVDGARGEEP